MANKAQVLSMLDKIADDEPMFLLRAQDMLAPEIVREWAYRAQCEGSPIEKCDEARSCANAQEQWQIAHRRKVPD
jgi:hypothetical protein